MYMKNIVSKLFFFLAIISLSQEVFSNEHETGDDYEIKLMNYYLIDRTKIQETSDKFCEYLTVKRVLLDHNIEYVEPNTLLERIKYSENQYLDEDDGPLYSQPGISFLSAAIQHKRQYVAVLDNKNSYELQYYDNIYDPDYLSENSITQADTLRLALKYYRSPDQYNCKADLDIETLSLIHI